MTAVVYPSFLLFGGRGRRIFIADGEVIDSQWGGYR